MNQKTLDGAIVVVTGATSGIGRATAEALAGKGAHVVIVSRDASRCAELAEHIARTGGVATFFAADLSNQREVRAAAEFICARFPRVDVLVNNAGAIFEKRLVSADGFEMTWALNHLSYFLLTHLLLEALKAAPAARIINVSSDAHFAVRHIPFDDLNFERRPYRAFGAYSLSKLANVMFTYALARRLEGTRVTANALHPGAVATNFGRNLGGLLGWAFRTLVARFALTPQQGAQTSIYLATTPEVARQSGLYFDRCRPKRSSPLSYDRDAQERLWAISAAQTGLAI